MRQVRHPGYFPRSAVWIAVLGALAPFTLSRAELGASYSPQVPYHYFESPSRLDDRIFDVGPEYPPQFSETGRYLARRPRYGREQRRGWIEECDSLRDVDFRQFQRCFRDRRRQFLRPERKAATEK